MKTTYYIILLFIFYTCHSQHCFLGSGNLSVITMSNFKDSSTRGLGYSVSWKVDLDRDGIIDIAVGDFNDIDGGIS